MPQPGRGTNVLGKQNGALAPPRRTNGLGLLPSHRPAGLSSGDVLPLTNSGGWGMAVPSRGMPTFRRGGAPGPALLNHTAGPTQRPSLFVFPPVQPIPSPGLRVSVQPQVKVAGDMAEPAKGGGGLPQPGLQEWPGGSWWPGVAFWPLLDKAAVTPSGDGRLTMRPPAGPPPAPGAEAATQ